MVGTLGRHQHLSGILFLAYVTLGRPVPFWSLGFLVSVSVGPSLDLYVCDPNSLYVWNEPDSGQT